MKNIITLITCFTALLCRAQVPDWEIAYMFKNNLAQNNQKLLAEGYKLNGTDTVKVMAISFDSAGVIINYQQLNNKGKLEKKLFYKDGLLYKQVIYISSKAGYVYDIQYNNKVLKSYQINYFNSRHFKKKTPLTQCSYITGNLVDTCICTLSANTDTVLYVHDIEGRLLEASSLSVYGPSNSYGYNSQGDLTTYSGGNEFLLKGALYSFKVEYNSNGLPYKLYINSEDPFFVFYR